MTYNLSGRIALVTGAAGPVGAAIARRLADEEATVLVADVADHGGQRLADDITRAGGSAVYVHLDVTSEQEWESAIVLAAQEFGGLDILVNCAGTGNSASIEEITAAQWQHAVEANQTGAFLGMMTAVDLLAVSEHGAVINVSPVIGDEDLPEPAGIAVSGAIRALTKAVASYWGPTGVRVNSIHPGFLLCQQRIGCAPEQLPGTPPLGRDGSPADVAEGVAYLASDAAAFVTGVALNIDGGYGAQTG